MDINKNIKLPIVLGVFVLILAECKPNEYEHVRAYVYNTQIFPLRNGYFKMEIKYEFEYDGDTIRGIYSTHKLPIAQKGDSLVVKFPIGSPRKKEVVSVIKVIQERIKL